MVIGEDENGERARAKVEVIADMPPEPPPVMEVRSELLVDERPRLVVGSAHSFASFGAAHVRQGFCCVCAWLCCRLCGSAAQLGCSARRRGAALGSARLGGAAAWLGGAARRRARRGSGGAARRACSAVVQLSGAALWRRRLGSAARYDTRRRGDAAR